ncbi:MAG: PSD1 and planctomycete cytochrome C domain-containing protein [Blastocatellia bacterium]
MTSRKPVSHKPARLALALTMLAAMQAGATRPPMADPPRFGRDVLPVIAANCFACHGPDEKNRQAGLRLDLEESAKAPRRNGAAIAPGAPDKSLILARMTSADPDVVMPPPAAHKQVSAAQLDTIRRWIAAGAKWGRHWSLEPVTRPVIAGGKHPIDALTSATLAKKGLAPRTAAAPYTLARRLSLDLTGLPPTPEIADQFAANPTPAAYERMVDALLQSPRFGEHWARMWLDLARYADTKGYEKDLGRTIWPWRDWVVNALNADMPLDQFTREQLAGDLLPEATEQQRIATAFHRNTMTNDEGGTDNEEFRVIAVRDRVDTTAQVWMGLTMGCAKCHTHKYDPISHAEYYSFFALFNQSEDADRSDDAPTIEMLSPEQQDERKDIQNLLKTLNGRAAALEQATDRDNAANESAWRVATAVEALSRDGATMTTEPDGVISVSGKAPPEDTFTVTLTLAPGAHTALRLEALTEALPSGQRAVGRHGASHFVLSELRAELADTHGAIVLRNARAAYADGVSTAARAIDGDEKTGWSVSGRGFEPHAALFDFATPLRLAQPARLRVTLSQQAGDAATLRRFRVATSQADPATLQPPLIPAGLRQTRDELAAAYKAQKQFNDDLVRLPVMRELAADKQRVTKIHLRGNFLEQGETVAPGVPAAFHPFPAGAPRNRLGLAQWLVSRDNTLTPRVWANRVWARLLGAGIVETEEDFGAQGGLPTNPELLDWLAAEYRDGGWSLKKLIKTIVTSRAYQQASDITPALREADPRNALLSRGARFRLNAEVIRDQALAVAGLLSAKMGGPPVMPPQPAGLWRSTYSTKTWVDAEGEDRFRRGLYTYLKRTTPYPSMITFDGGSGEICQLRRIRTNTPLQALVTLNDPVFMEAAAGLARRMTQDTRDTPARAARGLRLALIRPPRAGETMPLIALQKEAQQAFTAAPDKAEALLRTARAPVPPGISKPEFAAWIVTASAILNLDEFLTRN